MSKHKPLWFVEYKNTPTDNFIICVSIYGHTEEEVRREFFNDHEGKIIVEIYPANLITI